jgi:hypothetical protein
MLASSVGIAPVNTFSSRRSVVRFTRFPISVGISPIWKLKKAENSSKVVMSPICVGRLSLRKLAL